MSERDQRPHITIFEKLTSLTPYFPHVLTTLLIVIVVLGISVLVYVNSGTNTFKEIGENSSSFARGLITILFALITIVLALMLAFAALFSTAPDLEKRFSMGKEILAIFLGILGTIVGFYFGSAPIDNGLLKANSNVEQEIGSQKPAATIYLQIFDETQRAEAKKLQSELKTMNFAVPEIENVGDDEGVKVNPIKQNIIRYYNDVDSSNAEKVQTIIGTEALLQKPTGKFKVSPGTIEVWLKF